LWCLRAIVKIVVHNAWLICFLSDIYVYLNLIYCSTTHATATHPNRPEMPPRNAAGESHSLDARRVLRRRFARYFSSESCPTPTSRCGAVLTV
jgi:uncharacterized membrane protein